MQRPELSPREPPGDGGALPEPPYPEDIRARGMTLHIDVERMKQSGSWVKCPPAVRPWLLLMWVEAWVSSPAGTYEPDDEVIAGRMGMPLELFEQHRAHLMRGWTLCSDGRLYHGYMAEQVLLMTAARRKDRERMAAWRAGKAGAPAQGDGDPQEGAAGVGVTRDKREPTPGSATFATGTGTGTGTDEPTPDGVGRPSRKRSAASAVLGVVELAAEGVDKDKARDWLRLRAAKRLPLTPSAWQTTKDEAAKVGMTPAAAVADSVARDRAGFRASWVQRDRREEAGAPAGRGPKGPPPAAAFETRNYRDGIGGNGAL